MTQYLLGCFAAAQEAWAFDGGKNLITAHRLRLKGGIQLPTDKHGKLQVTVRDVPVAGKGKNADWQVRQIMPAAASLVSKAGAGVGMHVDHRLTSTGVELMFSAGERPMSNMDRR
jgi:hypothetical protein